MDLSEFQSWAMALARDLCRSDPSKVEDIAQEVLIEIWKADKIYDPTKGERIPFLKQRGKWRALGLLSGRANYEGNKNFTKHKGSPKDSPYDNFWLDSVYEDPDSDMVYHREEIREAVRSLSPRQRTYVFYRFWLDMREKELKFAMNMNNPHANWHSKQRMFGAKFRLREKLAHLEKIDG